MADIRAVVVDDEPLARAGVRRLLSQVADIVVVGEATNGSEAVDTIRRLKPDLLLLDIQMPEMNGFEVLNALDAEEYGAVIFITAYDSFAVRAFEVQALDYIMKPFDDERFFAVIDRAREHLSRGRDETLALRLSSLLQAYEQRAGVATPDPSTAGGDSEHRPGAFLSRVMVKESGRVFFQPVEGIDWIESADYYSRLHVGDATHLIRESMSALEDQLDPVRFVRIHRTAIVNVDRVKELRLDYANRHVVVLKNGTRLPLSRTRKDTLERVMSGGA
ncbi:MAG: LytTR family DNA-binding domain-containing protein [Longimicrobiales bacterium]